jgi:hypothetical protein
MLELRSRGPGGPGRGPSGGVEAGPRPIGDTRVAPATLLAPEPFRAPARSGLCSPCVGSGGRIGLRPPAYSQQTTVRARACGGIQMTHHKTKKFPNTRARIQDNTALGGRKSDHTTTHKHKSHPKPTKTPKKVYTKAPPPPPRDPNGPNPRLTWFVRRLLLGGGDSSAGCGLSERLTLDFVCV